ncbi:hypothetical protein B0H14DRAFT_3721690 [Mycena olivaceomarginata]|nr:hypothetical protein B0H14DRAFT_3721690 [Mycena olivaceomarginata]
MHEARQKATRPTMYGARIWAWKASRAARRDRDGRGGKARCTSDFLGLLDRPHLAAWSRKGRRDRREDPIRAHQKRKRRERRGNDAPAVRTGIGAGVSPDGTDAARWTCLAVHGEAFGHDYGQHTSGGPSPPHRTQATLACARWLVVLVQASYTPPTSTPTSGASTKAAHQDSSGDAQTESEVFHPYKRRTARGRGSSGLVILQVSLKAASREQTKLGSAVEPEESRRSGSSGGERGVTHVRRALVKASARARASATHGRKCRAAKRKLGRRSACSCRDANTSFGYGAIAGEWEREGKHTVFDSVKVLALAFRARSWQSSVGADMLRYTLNLRRRGRLVAVDDINEGRRSGSSVDGRIRLRPFDLGIHLVSALHKLSVLPKTDFRHSFFQHLFLDLGGETSRDHEEHEFKLNVEAGHREKLLDDRLWTNTVEI